MSGELPAHAPGQAWAAVHPLSSYEARGVPAGIMHSWRDTVESIVLAIILAFFFRGVVAEAFVIPTGSMAPTLQGRHMDVVCPQCQYQYRTGASIENADRGPPRGQVLSTRCPICRFPLILDKAGNANHHSFNGDRILVNKFAYAVAEPKRWDVIVFKYPGDAKTPYIKRLVGLPGETIQIRNGDIYTSGPGAESPSPRLQSFRIARKPPAKVVGMLQLVDDTNHQSQLLRSAGWPPRWQPWAPAGLAPRSNPWREAPDGAGYQVAAGPGISWLRYRHLIPRTSDWQQIQAGESPRLAGYQGQLITDYHAYNDFNSGGGTTDAGAQCWVGDLAVELEVEVARAQGELLLDLVEGGAHHRCTINLATGEAAVQIDGGQRLFVHQDRRASRMRIAATPLHEPGRHQVRFANVDDQLLLWVDGKLIQFDLPATFDSRPFAAPYWSPEDPGDLMPVGVGARNTELHVTRLRVLRDVYYRALGPTDPYRDSEYDRSQIGYGFDIAAVMANPSSWGSTPLFGARRTAQFKLGPDQFFPLGDNSPESRDARLWSEFGSHGSEPFPPPYVTRELLIGQAVFVYWPHAWRVGKRWLPLIPNFERMGSIP